VPQRVRIAGSLIYLQCIYVQGSLNFSHDLGQRLAANMLAFQDPVYCVMANTRLAFELANSGLQNPLLDFIARDHLSKRISKAPRFSASVPQQVVAVISLMCSCKMESGRILILRMPNESEPLARTAGH